MNQVRLSDYCSISMGQSPKGTECNDQQNGMPLLNGPTEFGFNHPTAVQWTTKPKKISKIGDLLFCVRGSTTGKMNWSDKEYVIGRGLASISPKFPNSIYFFRGLIENHLPNLLASATGSTFPNVSRSDLENIPIQVTDLKSIKISSKILEKIDKKIILNQKMNQTLEDTVKVIFKSWFIDFDPVRAKLEGKSTALPDEISDLFPSEFEESEIGLIPSNFSYGKLGDFLSIQGGYAFKSKDFGDEGFKIIKIKNILSDGSINFSDCDHVNIQDKKLERFILKDGDAIVAMTGATVGKVGLVNSVDTPIYLNQRVGKLISKNEINDKKCWFSYLNLTSNSVRGMIEAFAYGSAQPNISTSDIEFLPAIVPSAKLIKEFNNLVNPIYQKILLSYREMHVLINLKDAILPKLISGEIQISDAEKLLHEAGI